MAEYQILNLGVVGSSPTECTTLQYSITGSRAMMLLAFLNLAIGLIMLKFCINRYNECLRILRELPVNDVLTRHQRAMMDYGKKWKKWWMVLVYVNGIVVVTSVANIIFRIVLILS